MSTYTTDDAFGSGGRRARRRLEHPRLQRGPVRRLLTLVGLSAALIGAGVMAALLFAVGAFGETSQSSSATASTTTAPNWAAIYAKADPGVIAITATGLTSSSGEAEVATGTGQVLDTNGDVLTASHVIAGATSVTIKLPDGTARKATVLGTDRSVDVSVLHFDPAGLTLHPLPLGSASALVVGDPLAVIGNPFGFNRSLSTGVVSALDRTIAAPNGFAVAHAIQTDAAINPGNSGGPMLNARGEVVGFVDQIATGNSEAASDTGVGFAIPIEVVRSELSQLEHGVAVAHAYVGAGTTQALQADGALVNEVAAGSPAASAGLRPGDLVTAVDGTEVRGPSGFVSAVAAHRPGERLTLTVRRGTSTLALTVTLASQTGQTITG
jgi:putative serine protease PepD